MPRSDAVARREPKIKTETLKEKRVIVMAIFQGFGSGSGSARMRMFLPWSDPDQDPHKFADPDPDSGKKVRE